MQSQLAGGASVERQPAQVLAHRRGQGVLLQSSMAWGVAASHSSAAPVHQKREVRSRHGVSRARQAAALGRCRCCRPWF